MKAQEKGSSSDAKVVEVQKQCWYECKVIGRGNHRKRTFASRSFRSLSVCLYISLLSRCEGEENIPVLSEQMTLTLPSASTDGNFLTIAFRFDIRSTPRARVTVVTIGSPSGIAATASDTASQLEFQTQPRRHTSNSKHLEPSSML